MAIVREFIDEFNLDLTDVGSWYGPVDVSKYDSVQVEHIELFASSTQGDFEIFKSFGNKWTSVSSVIGADGVTDLDTTEISTLYFQVADEETTASECVAHITLWGRGEI